jgi:hypothetical protein
MRKNLCHLAKSARAQTKLNFHFNASLSTVTLAKLDAR